MPNNASTSGRLQNPTCRALPREDDVALKKVPIQPRTSHDGLNGGLSATQMALGACSSPSFLLQVLAPMLCLERSLRLQDSIQRRPELILCQFVINTEQQDSRKLLDTDASNLHPPMH